MPVPARRRAGVANTPANAVNSRCKFDTRNRNSGPRGMRRKSIAGGCMAVDEGDAFHREANFGRVRVTAACLPRGVGSFGRSGQRPIELADSAAAQAEDESILTGRSERLPHSPFRIGSFSIDIATPAIDSGLHGCRRHAMPSYLTRTLRPPCSVFRVPSAVRYAARNVT
ncbi:hypothetical protein X946_3910 [Burkholderia sp. ABCPW 111]|nr:hypothetical protein X946_3910 [Burkholderia sp. ABCPW 111]